MRYLEQAEQEEAIGHLSQYEWTHTITLSSFGDDVTAGKIYLQVTEGMQRLLHNDPSAEFAFYVCKNGQGRVHSHGVISTTLKHIRIQGCFRGGWAKIFASQPNIYGWYEYIAKQALAETLITNTQESFV